MSVDIVRIIKELGKGMQGTVYLAESMDNQYALKVTKKNALNRLKLKHELEFCEKVAHKHPESFQRLIDWKITSNKIKRLYNLVEGNLAQIDASQDVWITIFAQMVAIFILVNEARFAICDLYNIANIGYVKTNDNNITIGKHKIPLKGYRVVLIDYDDIYTDTLPMDNKMTNLYRQELHHAHGFAIWHMADMRKFWDVMDRKKIPDSVIYNWCVQTPEWAQIFDKLYNVNPDKQLGVWHFYLYRIIYLSKIEKHIKCKIPMQLRCPIDLIIKCINHRFHASDLLKIILTYQ